MWLSMDQTSRTPHQVSGEEIHNWSPMQQDFTHIHTSLPKGCTKGKAGELNLNGWGISSWTGKRMQACRAEICPIFRLTTYHAWLPISALIYLHWYPSPGTLTHIDIRKSLLKRNALLKEIMYEINNKRHRKRYGPIKNNRKRQSSTMISPFCFGLCIQFLSAYLQNCTGISSYFFVQCQIWELFSW